MKVYPDITLTRLFMVMKTLVNFKAHNLKVVGSNPTPATNNYVVIQQLNKALGFSTGGFFAFFGLFTLTFTLTFIPMLVRIC